MQEVNIIKDSINPRGTRITTFELVYPRFVHCFDETTEVLSQIGDEMPEFRSFKAVSALGIKVGQYENGKIEMVYPTAHIEKQGVHKMVSSDKKLFPFFSTEGHRVLIHKRTTDNKFLPKTIEASELLGSYGTVRIPQSGIFEDEQFYSNDELALITWFVADGHKPKVGSQIQFHFKKQRKIDAVKKLLQNLAIEFTESVYGDNTVIRLQEPSWVSMCYDENRKKQFPESAMHMTMEGYLVFKQALLESDGNVTNQDYNTTVLKVAEQIQMMAVLHNDSINLQQSTYAGIYKLTFKDSNYISLRQDKDLFTNVEFEGTVYCVSVPSSYIVVRRKGVVFVTGNCELMTHRVFSRNSASSRAIPVQTMLDLIESNPATPVHWGKNQPGMQAKSELESEAKARVQSLWQTACMTALNLSKRMFDEGAHKQVANRITEPFQHMKVVVTSTDFGNWFWLRNHEDADPTIKALASEMLDKFIASRPQRLYPGEWHLPYVNTTVTKSGDVEYLVDDKMLDVEHAKMISVSCCAQVSYRKSDTSLEKAEAIYKRLIESVPVHSSPCEHQAVCFDSSYYWPEGTTHRDKKGTYYSGNFKDWIQFRQLIPDNVFDASKHAVVNN